VSWNHKYPAQHVNWSNTKQRHHHDLIKITSFRHDMAENCSLSVKQQSLTHSSYKEKWVKNTKRSNKLV